MGGMHGFGPVSVEQNEPVFHAEWEKRTYALMSSLRSAGHFNIDEGRYAVERIPPAAYLSSSYYERWLRALETLLVEKGIVRPDELPPLADAASPRDKVAASSRTRTGRNKKNPKPRFRPGDRVIARNFNTEGHTRLPRYARGKRGLIRFDWGAQILPDAHAADGSEAPQHCYCVSFEARELWGKEHPARERVYIDLWQDYLIKDYLVKDKPPPRKPRPRAKKHER